MKKIKMFMGAVLCMNLLTLSGCDRIVQSAVVEEKDQTEQKKEEKKETVQKTVAEQVQAPEIYQTTIQADLRSADREDKETPMNFTLTADAPVKVPDVDAICLKKVKRVAISEEEQNKNEETAEENKEEDKVQIGLTVDSFVIERWIRDRDVFVATARELGAEVNVQDAGADVKEQISQIEYFINKQVDVIVVIARDCGALSDAIQKAQSAGIPVISYDRMVNNANTDLYISFDNRKVGEIMAQALVNALPQGGDVFMIQGSSSDNNVQMVKQGFDDMLADTDLHVVYEANCDGWTAELAAGYVEEALEKYPHVKGIMCGNDDIASQVVQVLAENQLAGNVVVVGQDGDLAACQRIVEGTQYMTAFKPIEDLARKAAKYAVEMGSGKGVAELEDVTETVNDGTYEIPSCILEPTAVTKENIDKVIIEGGFHRRDEVYLNADYS